MGIALQSDLGTQVQMNFPHLSRAPITEALIDIRVAPGLKNHECLIPFQDAVKESFPNQKRQIHVQSNIAVPADEEHPQTTSTSNIHGYICWSADRLRVIQANLNGFAFSHLRPYDRWTSLRDQTRQLWQVYRQITQPSQITRCAVRYINRLELPITQAELQKFLNIGPALPPRLSDALRGIFMSLRMQIGPSSAIVTIADDENAGPGARLSIILDIDVFEEAELLADDERLWDHLERLRDLKNDIFFRCLTPNALGLYQ